MGTDCAVNVSVRAGTPWSRLLVFGPVVDLCNGLHLLKSEASLARVGSTLTHAHKDGVYNIVRSYTDLGKWHSRLSSVMQDRSSQREFARSTVICGP